MTATRTPTPPVANADAMPNAVPRPEASSTLDCQATHDAQRIAAVEGPFTPPVATLDAMPEVVPRPEGLNQDGSAAAKQHAAPSSSSPTAGPSSQTSGSASTRARSAPIPPVSLADPFLALAADVLDDTERTKIANQNRLRQLTRNEPDKDGEERGFGLDETHPDVRRLASLVEMLSQVEHDATLNLARKMREHPLGPWVKAQKGVGDKQAARLLATIGDPYINSATGEPRTVSQLWAYCGLHVLPAADQLRPVTQDAGVGGGFTLSTARRGTLPASQDVIATQDGLAGGLHFPADQVVLDAHTANVGRDSSTSGDPNHGSSDHVGVAARRQRGKQVNWSTTAKSRAYLIAESMLRSGNREVYDRRKAATEGKLHAAPCVRCGPSGRPAQVGTPWSAAHRHADALRIVSKELLKGLWREAYRIHEEARA